MVAACSLARPHIQWYPVEDLRDFLEGSIELPRAANNRRWREGERFGEGIFLSAK